MHEDNRLEAKRLPVRERVARLFAEKASHDDARSGDFYRMLPYVEYVGVENVPDREGWLASIAEGIASFRGVDRRFEVVGEAGGVLFVDDYAHHPTEVLATLPDDAFAHDGQLTKRDVRAAALARLRPQPGQLLWDVGAGAGSVAVAARPALPQTEATSGKDLMILSWT